MRETPIRNSFHRRWLGGLLNGGIRPPSSCAEPGIKLLSRIPVRSVPGVRAIMDSLLALQALEFPQRKPGSDEERARLRAGVPEPVLGHYDRLVARGKKGVASVRQGVCVECHIRVPMGMQLTLARGADIQICGNCGRYLHLAESEFPGKPEAKAEEKPAVKRGRRKREPSVSF